MPMTQPQIMPMVQPQIVQMPIVQPAPLTYSWCVFAGGLPEASLMRSDGFQVGNITDGVWYERRQPGVFVRGDKLPSYAPPLPAGFKLKQEGKRLAQSPPLPQNTLCPQCN
jgi:hypothetical protein